MMEPEPPDQIDDEPEVVIPPRHVKTFNALKTVAEDRERDLALARACSRNFFKHRPRLTSAFYRDSEKAAVVLAPVLGAVRRLLDELVQSQFRGSNVKLDGALTVYRSLEEIPTFNDLLELVTEHPTVTVTD